MRLAAKRVLAAVAPGPAHIATGRIMIARSVALAMSADQLRTLVKTRERVVHMLPHDVGPCQQGILTTHAMPVSSSSLPMSRAGMSRVVELTAILIEPSRAG